VRVVIVGAGVVGACTALALRDAGLEVTVVERDQVASGTSSRAEGNVLVSDKPPGPELDLALDSSRRWAELAHRVGSAATEYEPKGGLVVATSPEALGPLQDFAQAQRAAGVIAEPVTHLQALEPHLARSLPGGIYYPQDAQVQPVLATVAVLREAVREGAAYRPGVEVTGVRRRPDGTLVAVTTSAGELPADVVVNAAGTWGGRVGERLGAPVPVLPRRGFLLVTEPLPPFVRHKVYSADYVANVAASTEQLQTSCVVEGTRGGTIVIGASRERVGFDATMSAAIVARLARQAVALFPRLAEVSLLRVYRGFRPYCPDHLPVIGPDPRAPGVVHACGHEGAGIGLAPATGALVAAMLTGRTPAVDPAPFRPERLIEPSDDPQARATGASA
jgi:glycine/D-amino acid oxidase-like deaminating enzyme